MNVTGVVFHFGIKPEPAMAELKMYFVGYSLNTGRGGGGA